MRMPVIADKYIFYNPFPCVFWPTWTTVDALTVRIFDVYLLAKKFINKNQEPDHIHC